MSPDGELLAVESQADESPNSRVEVLDLALGRELYSRPLAHGTGSLYFSPDGDQLAAAGCCQGGSTVKVWDARTGGQEFSPLGGGNASSVAFSPNGRLLATGTGDGKVTLLNADDGTPAGADIQAATGAIDPVSFSPDSRLLVASSADQTASLWDVTTHKPVGGTFPVTPGAIPTAQFSPAGELVIVGLSDATVWPMDPEVWEDFACRAAGRDLTEAEWEDLLPDRDFQPTCPQ